MVLVTGANLAAQQRAAATSLPVCGEERRPQRTLLGARLGGGPIMRATSSAADRTAPSSPPPPSPSTSKPRPSATPPKSSSNARESARPLPRPRPPRPPPPPRPLSPRPPRPLLLLLPLPLPRLLPRVCQSSRLLRPPLLPLPPSPPPNRRRRPSVCALSPASGGAAATRAVAAAAPRCCSRPRCNPCSSRLGCPLACSTGLVALPEASILSNAWRNAAQRNAAL